MNQPNADIPWSRTKVFATFEGPPRFWDRAQIPNEPAGRYRQGD
jgi:hypothetical protein